MSDDVVLSAVVEAVTKSLEGLEETLVAIFSRLCALESRVEMIELAEVGGDIDA
jgi:hypothetical protein